MKLREYGFLIHLQDSKTKVKPVKEVANICLDCSGKCKAAKGLIKCGLKVKFNAHS